MALSASGNAIFQDLIVLGGFPMKTARVAAIVLCMALLILPSAAMPLWGSRQSTAENRVLADYPALLDEEGALNGSFDEDFEAWLCDHFALRSAAVRANALMRYRLLHSSASDQVVAGRGDWLYFSPTVPDFTGEGRLTEDELSAISANLRAFAEAYERQGARVYLAIVPNKSTIYPQYMPERYPMRDTDGNLPLLREACEGLPLTWIDLATPLATAAGGERLVYYKTDTHWNALGAAIAAREVLKATGAQGCGYRESGDAPFSDGDLARLMGLSGALTEQAPEVVPEHALPEADFAQREFSVTGNGTGRLTVFRDSFGTAMGPWLSDAYGRCEMIWKSPLEAGHVADDVLILICERNIREYLLSEVDLAYEAPEGEDEYVHDEAPVDRAGFVEMDEDDDFFGEDEDDDFFGEDEDDDFFGEDEDEAFFDEDEDEEFFDDGDADSAMGRVNDGI